MIEISFPEGNFLKIAETLTRIGIANRRKKTLTQTANILHKKGKYYIIHFLELFELDGKESCRGPLEDERVEGIVRLLESWGLCEPLDDIGYGTLEGLTIIKFSEKRNWKLIKKYRIGKK